MFGGKFSDGNGKQTMNFQQVQQKQLAPRAKVKAKTAARGGGAGRRERAAILTALAFLLPNLIGFLAFTFFPVLFSLWMSFTNWSLKPAVKFEYVGLRNFTDLLGVNATGPGAPAVLAGFLVCALAVTVALVGALWANMAQWRGIKLGGALLALTGAGFVFVGCTHSLQGLVLGGGAALICGWSMAAKDAPWEFGRGTLPGLVLSVGAVGLWLLSGAMTHAYQPRDPYFWQFFYNTIFLMIGIPFGIAGSLALALLLHQDLPTGEARQRTVGAATMLVIGLVMGGVIWTQGNPNAGLIVGLLWMIAALGIGFNVVAFRTLFYLPTFTAGVALMILWKALYNPKTGPINVGLNAIFHALGIHATAPEWLGDVAWAKPALVLMGTWTCIGGTSMLLYLAGLSNVPKELTEAADIDGAGPWAQFRHVTWPQLAPTTFFITITSIIGGLQGGFEQARIMTAGGPAGSTTTLSYYIYNKAFQDLDMGYASAISWILFAIVFAATALNWKFGKGLEVD
jgi:multiple sugar transport system permease protein